MRGVWPPPQRPLLHAPRGHSLVEAGGRGRGLKHCGTWDCLNQESKILFIAKFYPLPPTTGRGLMRRLHVIGNKHFLVHLVSNEYNFATSLYNWRKEAIIVPNHKLWNIYANFNEEREYAGSHHMPSQASSSKQISQKKTIILNSRCNYSIESIIQCVKSRCK